MGYLERAAELEKELINNRRTLHSLAETGFELPKTLDFVMSELCAYGLEPKLVGKSGLSCKLGGKGKTFLLRCDMDALAMREDSGLDFASFGGTCHSCGHDAHMAMMLCAAKMLKEREMELKGTVRIVFQPAEEILSGAKDMIAAGILKNPPVDAALGLHILAGLPFSKSGHVLCRAGQAMNSASILKITIKGLAAHGSTPYLGVDAIGIAAHITLALQEIITREVPSEKEAVILVGTVSGGTTSNTVAAEASLGVSVRADNSILIEKLHKRIKEVSEGIAGTFGGSALVSIDHYAPPLMNDPELTGEIEAFVSSLLSTEKAAEYPKMSCTEDFAYIAEKVPATFLILGGGSIDEGYTASLHNPKVIFDEEAFKNGAAVMAHCAEEWLKKHSK